MADDASQLLTVAQAIAILDAEPVRPRPVDVPLDDALGLHLAEDLVADRDYPPFDKSLMDGYAVRRADVAPGGAELRVTGEIAAGHRPPAPLAPGDAQAIMTGAPLPDGADGVVPVEQARRTGDLVRIEPAGAADFARYIARRGADLRAGETVLRRGAELQAPQLAAAATVGAATLRCFARPRACVLSTGDEIVSPAAPPGPSQIRNSNSPMLRALLARYGCRVTDLGHARDDPAELRERLAAGLEQGDLLFVTGGMSMGAYDHVPRLLRELGVEIRIAKLRIKPGKPFVFGVRSGSETFHLPEARAVVSQRARYVFGLPGNPVSSFVCTVRLAARLIARLSGGAPAERWVHGHLAAAVGPAGGREFYQPARLERGPDRVAVHPLDWKGSADLFTLARADALLVRPEGEGPLPPGTPVRVLEF